MTGGEEGVQRGDGETGRAGEDQDHRFSVLASQFSVDGGKLEAATDCPVLVTCPRCHGWPRERRHARPRLAPIRARGPER
jgi:hypothetical protein